MIVQRILHTAEKFPEKQAIVYGLRSLSYAELSEEIKYRAGAYQHRVTAPKVILTHAHSLENLLDLLALMALGKASIMASTQLNEEQIQGLLEQEEATTLPPRNQESVALTEIQSATLTDRFLGVLTSGTESTPKVIWKDYQSWVTAFPHQSDVFGITPDDRLFVLDALSYSANLNSVLHMLWQGGTVVMTSLKSAASWPRQMQEQQISSVFMVPSHYRLWAKKSLSLPGIRSLVSAGEKLEASLAEILLACCPDVLLTEYYGAAELGHVSYQQNQEIIQHSYAVGQAFPGVKIKIVDQRILVESDYVSPDYRGVNTVFDLGLIEDGRLILMGRSGRMFNRRGLNVFAEEIENSAKLLPFVTEVAVIGLLREDLSHDIYLVFSASYPGHVQANYSQQLKTHLLHSLPTFKQPRRILELRNLPRKDNGKIDYHAVARIFSEEDSLATLER
ncbi:hypothetical protein BWI96_04405 [Siphonobacter sp. SORGH_AS_0500]|uniref:AMP-binding protein n=1 Tax=Siphonobacter sp. SORGH_AS_0500 TaxID=1864824 RepID=UPI000CCAE1FE|nr:AMP-binding protein [Siphonobacter sp. SORGH_AS_0500]PKK37715.1 hypothetical protein BWI96_04405 [Siphonobacter sp. SORGH_AS_0500]